MERGEGQGHRGHANHPGVAIAGQGLSVRPHMLSNIKFLPYLASIFSAVEGGFVGTQRASLGSDIAN
jgi:hypothetical protein